MGTIRLIRVHAQCCPHSAVPLRSISCDSVDVESSVLDENHGLHYDLGENIPTNSTFAEESCNTLNPIALEGLVHQYQRVVTVFINLVFWSVFSQVSESDKFITMFVKSDRGRQFHFI